MHSSPLSQLLLAELKKWEVIQVPTILYTGCRSTDIGVDIPNRKLAGNKWFSIDPYFAGEHAWHFSRDPNKGEPYRIEVTMHSISAVRRPDNFCDKGEFVSFLYKCFPHVACDYRQSRNFQDVLGAHLTHLHGNGVVGYSWLNCKEVLIPSCENWISSIEVIQLPTTKGEYEKLNGLI